MSAELIKRITFRLRKVEVLTGDALEAQDALQALVPAANVRQGNLDTSVGFPQVTFRQSGGTPNRLSHEQIGVIGQPEFDFEVWTDDRRGDTASNILDLIEQLLDDRRGVVNPLTGAAGYKQFAMHILTDAAVFFDSITNRWFGLQRYQAIEGRWKQGT